MAVDKETLRRWREAIDGHIERGFPGLFMAPAAGRRAPVVAICWPHRHEYDARHVAARLRIAGAVIALPVVITPHASLIFREWHPGTTLTPGAHDIPCPASDSPVVRPTVLLLPMVGFDAAGHRLGFGGGYFDRTLAELSASRESRPTVIGVGYELSKMATIHPEPHDMPMNFVVTEAGIYRRETGEGDRATLVFLGAPPQGQASALSSPVCYADEIDPQYFGKT